MQPSIINRSSCLAIVLDVSDSRESSVHAHLYQFAHIVPERVLSSYFCHDVIDSLGYKRDRSKG